MNDKRCKWKKSRELKEGGALLMKKRLIHIDNQWFTISAPPPKNKCTLSSSFRGEVHASLSFDYQGVICQKTVKVHPPLSTLVKKILSRLFQKKKTEPYCVRKVCLLITWAYLLLLLQCIIILTWVRRIYSVVYCWLSCGWKSSEGAIPNRAVR